MKTMERNTYHEMRAKITGNRTSKKVGNNTYLQVRDAEAVALRLHATDILTFKADGSIVLNSGGWRTITTKARMNEFLNDWYVSQNKGVWFIGKRSTGFKNDWGYQDGMILLPDGTVFGAKTVDIKVNAKADLKDRKIKTGIKKYCVAFVNALEAGEIKKDTSGDCFYCQMREIKTNRPLGEVSPSDHLQEHIRENYFVLSLLRRAFETMPVSIAMNQYVASALEGEGSGNVFSADFVRASVVKVLYRYVCRQYGYAS